MSPQYIEDVVEWNQFGDLEHFRYSILHIDEEQQRAEILFKFEPHKPIILHRHNSLNKLLVLKGEHHIYDADGTLSEVRATGSYTVAQPSDAPHAECGGDGGTIILFSIFDNTSGGTLYDLMDPEQNIVGTLSMSDLVAIYTA
ncbi:cupin domain-containing protein [Neptuniibacter marinus]|uniref:cupin domain-containing protein n=1 Tax=Neptuniibacter marinus TaxID=1806670 RepID=UPI0008320658|nr:hypothetical protein [Neptuniibacter marinus]